MCLIRFDLGRLRPIRADKQDLGRGDDNRPIKNRPLFVSRCAVGARLLMVIALAVLCLGFSSEGSADGRRADVGRVVEAMRRVASAPVGP
jgi:hypothetical protein